MKVLDLSGRAAEAIPARVRVVSNFIVIDMIMDNTKEKKKKAERVLFKLFRMLAGEYLELTQDRRCN